MAKLKVKDIVNINSSESWDSIADKVLMGAKNQIISSSKPLAGSMAIFGIAMKIYSGAMIVSRVIETAVPLINLAVKITGAITNPTLIGSIAQDLATIIAKMSLFFINTGILAIKELILNYEFFFPDVTADTIAKIQEKTATKLKEIRDTGNNVLNNSNPIIVPNGTINTMENDLIEEFETLDDLINSHLSGLNSSGQTPETWRTLILSTVETDLNNSTLPTGIEENMDSIYEFVLTQIKEYVAQIENQQREAMSSIDVSITKLTIGLNDTAIMNLNKLKDIFMNMQKEAEIFYKKQIFDETTYKEHPDVSLLINTFKVRIEDEIKNKKIKYYKDVQKIILLSDDIETIRANAISIVFEEINLYNLFKLSVMNPVKQTMIQNNEAADLYNVNKTQNNIYIKVAAELFNNLLPRIIEYIISRNTLVKGHSFTSGEVEVEFLDTMGSIVLTNLSDFVTAMPSFSLSSLIIETEDQLNNYALNPIVNDDACDHLTFVKKSLYQQFKNILNNEVVGQFFKLFPVTYPSKFNNEEKIIIGNYILDSVKLFAKNTLQIGYNVIFLNDVPCLHCTDCSGFKSSIIASLNIVEIPKLKKNIYDWLIDSYNFITPQDKPTFIAFLNDSNTLNYFNEINSSEMNLNTYNGILETVYYYQENMMIDGIASKIRI